MSNIGKDKNAACFHEDEYLMIELVPLCEYGKYKEMFESKSEVIEDIFSLSEDELNELEKPVKRLEQMNINKELFVNNLDEDIPVFSKVQTGYSDFYKYINNTIALGSERFRVFLEFDNQGTIENIWLHNSIEEVEQIKDADALRKFICSKFKFACFDWYTEVNFDFSNEEHFYAYMHSTINRIKETRKRFGL